MEDQNLYNEEQRQILLDTKQSIDTLITKTSELIEQYVEPKDEVVVSGQVEVNTEKQIEVTNLESIKEYFNEMSEQIQESIKTNSFEPLKEITIKNITDAQAKEIKVSNIQELADYIKPLVQAVVDKEMTVNVQKQEVVFPTSPSKPIPVRLSDGKSFYTAIMSAMSSGSAVFKDQNNKGVQVVLDSSGNVPTNPNNSTLAFSTNSTLGNGVTYDSTVISLEEWTQVQTSILSDVDGTVLINFCKDSAGADILRTLTIPYIGGSGFQTFSAPAFTPFVRYRFTADEVGQTDFYFDTKFLKVPLSAQVLGADAFISPAMTSSLTRSILVGKTAGGYYNNVAIEPVSNSLDIAIPRSSFGELSTITPTPVVQADFIYNINTDLVDTIVTGSGTVTQANALAVLQTTANASSSAKLQTKRVIKYRPGQGAVIRGTALFTTGVANSEQLFGAGDDSNGFFFGYNGTAFGIMSRVGGVDTWVAQTAWNGDIMNGAGGINNPTAQLLDPTKGNVYQIRYQWLGFGLIEFDIEDSATGRFVKVHSIPYANSYTTPSLLNPSFPIMWSAKNTTNATNITVKGASCLGQIEGKIEYLGPTNAIGFSKVGVTTTLTNIITIRNKSTFALQTNRTPINILKYTTSVDGNKPAQFNLVKNATLGGTPSWTSISTNTSVVEYDTAGTTVTGGKVIDFATLASTGSLSNSDVSPTDIILLPGETLTLAVNATATTTDVTSAIRWVEDF